MDLKIESADGSRAGVRVLRLVGPFTLPGTFEFQSLVRRLPGPVTIVDLTEVPFMDSAALGAVLFLHAHSMKHQRQYALVGAAERLKMLFALAGVDEILTTYATVDEAETALVGKATPG